MPAGKFTNYIIDSSYVLSFLLPDENQSDVVELFDQYTLGNVGLVAPNLLSFEVINGIKGAILSKRLDLEEAKVLINKFSDLTIALEDISLDGVLEISVNKGLSVYDASYLYLSKFLDSPLLTLDKKLQDIS
jgi:predicted nucleic acid-binding protein